MSFQEHVIDIEKESSYAIVEVCDSNTSGPYSYYSPYYQLDEYLQEEYKEVKSIREFENRTDQTYDSDERW